MIKVEADSNIVELSSDHNSEMVMIKVINQSNVIDYFNIVIEPSLSPDTPGIDPAWITFTPPTFSLRPLPQNSSPAEGESQQTVQVIIRLPAGVNAGTYVGNIRILARTGDNNSAIIPFSIVMQELERQTIKVEPEEIITGKSRAFYRVTLTNEGNSPHIYSVYAEDQANACQYTVTPYEVQLAPGQEANLTLMVRPKPRNWTDDDRMHTFMVKLDGYPQTAPARLTQKCALPVLRWFQRKWKLLAAIAVVLLVVTLVVMVFLYNAFGQVLSVACAPFSQREVTVVGNNIRSQIYVSGPNATSPQKLIAEESATQFPGVFQSLVSISPDGRRVAYVTSDSLALDKNVKITVVEVDNPQNKRIVEGVGQNLWNSAPVWSSNSERLVYFKRKTDTAVAPATAQTTAVSSPTGTSTAPPATPTTVASPQPVAVAGGGNLLEVWSAKIGEPAKLVPITQTVFTSDVVNQFYGSKDGKAKRPVCFSNNGDSVVLENLSPRVEIKLETGEIRRLDANSALQNVFGTIVPTVNIPTIGIPTVGVPTVGVPRLGEGNKQRLGVSSDSLVLGMLQQPATSPTPTVRPINQPQGSAEGGCAIGKLYSQNDPTWANRLLRSNINAVMGEQGCAITAASLLMNAYGDSDTRPTSLADCLGDRVAPLEANGWNFIATPCSRGLLRGGERRSFQWADLNNALRNGPAIVGLIGGPTGTHFVIAISGSGEDGKRYRVVDPWDGSDYKNLDMFIRSGYRLGWLISYQGQNRNPCSLANPLEPDGDLRINISGVQDGGVYAGARNVTYNIIGGNPAGVTGLVRFTNQNGDLALRQISLTPGVSRSFTEDGIYFMEIAPNGTNSLDDPNIRRLTWIIDTKPPSITYTLNTSPDPKTGLYPVPVGVSFLAQDALSGVATIEYQINNGQVRQYTSDTTKAPLQLDRGNTTYIVAFWAIDGAGNRSPLQFFTVQTAQATVAGGNNTGTGTETGGTSGTPVAGSGSNTGNATGGGNNAAGGGNNAAGGATGANLAATQQAVLQATLNAQNQAAQATLAAIQRGTPRPTQPIFIPPTTAPPVVATTAPPVVATTAPPAVETTTPPAATTTAAPTTAVALPTTTVAATTAAATTTAVPSATPTFTPVPLAVLGASTSQIIFEPGVLSTTIQLRNTGNTALNWTAQLGTLSNILTLVPASGTIAPNSTQIIQVTLINPNTTAQNITGNIQVTSNGGNQNISVTIKPPAGPTAVFTSPGGGQLAISTTVTLQVNIPNGAKQPDHATLTASFCTTVTPNCTPTDQAIPVEPDKNNNWTVIWNTADIPPQNNVTLKGVLCTSVDESACTPITPVTGLSTALTVVANSPTTNTVLFNKNQIALVPPSSRVNNVQVKAVQNNVITPISPALTAANDWRIDWDTTNLSPSQPITLTATACTNPTNTVCQDFTLATNLQVAFRANFSFNQDLSLVKKLPISLTVVLTPTDSTFTTKTNFTQALIYGTFRGVGQAGATRQVISSFTMTAGNNWSGSWTDLANLPVQQDITLELVVCKEFNENTCFKPLTIPPNLPNIFSGLEVAVGDPTNMIGSSLSSPAAQINTAFLERLQVRVTDSKGNLVPNQPVRFTAPTSGASGKFAGVGNEFTGTTDASGVVTASVFTANGTIGQYVVTASLVNFPTVPAISFNLSNVSLGASFIKVIAGSNQQVRINEIYPTSLRVRVETAAGVGLQNVPVNFIAPANGSSGSFNLAVPDVVSVTVLSDINGFAQAPQFRANFLTGQFNVTAIAQGDFIPGVFSLENLKGLPNSITAVSPTNLQFPIDFTLSGNNTFRVRVTDIGGNELDNIPVIFTAPATGASGVFVSNGQNTTTVSTGISPTLGIADAGNFRLNLTAGGPYTVAANTVPPLPSGVVFTVTNDVGAPTFISATTATTQQAQVQAVYSPGFAVRVTDVGNNPVPNTSVTFAVVAPNAASGSFGGQPSVNVNTAANGIAIAPNFTANCSVGSFSVQASLGVISTTFNLQNTVGAPALINDTTGAFSPFQNVPVGSNSSIMIARVTDSCSNPVSGVVVTFNAPVGGGATGTFAGGTSTANGTTPTNANGEASAPIFTANNIASATPYSITANITPPLATPARFAVRNIPGNPAFVTVDGGTSPQTTNVGTPFASPLQVVVTDQFGNRVLNGIDVTFFAPPNTPPNPSVSFAGGTTVQTDNNGVAISPNITANGFPGSYTVTATTNTVPPPTTATFNLTNNNPNPTLTSLDITSAALFSADITPLTVTLTGTGFAQTSQVRWNGATNLATTFVSGTQLQAQITSAELVTVGTNTISVFNPTPGGGTSGTQNFTVTFPNPTLTSINPTNRTAGTGDFVLTLNGSNFSPSTLISWNTTTISPTSVTSTTLTANISASLIDIPNGGTTRQIRVYNPAPTSPSAPQTFTINNPPVSVTGISSAPNTTANGTAKIITINGTGFVAGQTTISWNGSTYSPATVQPNGLQLTFSLPATATVLGFSGNMTVSNPNPGASNASQTFTLDNPLPDLDSINPTSRQAGTGDFTLTVTGSNFNASAVISWNTTALPTFFVNSTTLTATVNGTLIGNSFAGQTRTIRVFSPAPGGGTSVDSATFSIDNPAPQITSISPTNAVAGTATFTLDVNGFSFSPNTVVRWNGVAVDTSFNSPTSLSATISDTLIAMQFGGITRTVDVFTPAPGGGASPTQEIFTINNPDPTINALPGGIGSAPDRIADGTAKTITLNGTGYVAGQTTVTWNGSTYTPATVQTNGTQLTFTLPATATLQGFGGPMTVTNPTPGGGNASRNYILSNPAPTLSSVVPNNIAAGSADSTIILTGTGFNQSSVVEWEGTALATTYVNGTQLTAVVTNTLLAVQFGSQTRNITVVNPTPGGGTSGALTFTINNPIPTINPGGISPASVLADSTAKTITINGTGFVSGQTTVTWNGSTYIPTTVLANGTQLTFSLPATATVSGLSGNMQVTNPTPGGGNDTEPFTINNPAPTINAGGLTPANVVAGTGDFTLQVTGTGYTPNSVINWNGTALTTFFVNTTTVTATIASSRITYTAVAALPLTNQLNITVTNPTPGGGTSLARIFTVNNPVPTFAVATPITPATTPTSTVAINLTINGTGFISGRTTVEIAKTGPGTSVQTPVTINAAGTQLTVQIPATYLSTPGTITIRLINATPGGGNSPTTTTLTVT